jgi:hypothetical protein
MKGRKHTRSIHSHIGETYGRLTIYKEYSHWKDIYFLCAIVLVEWKTKQGKSNVLRTKTDTVFLWMYAKENTIENDEDMTHRR